MFHKLTSIHWLTYLATIGHLSKLSFLTFFNSTTVCHLAEGAFLLLWIMDETIRLENGAPDISMSYKHTFPCRCRSGRRETAHLRSRLLPALPRSAYSWKHRRSTDLASNPSTPARTLGPEQWTLHPPRSPSDYSLAGLVTSPSAVLPL